MAQPTHAERLTILITGITIGILFAMGIFTLKTDRQKQMIQDLRDSYQECRDQLSNR